jgi:hypothetical protein
MLRRTLISLALTAYALAQAPKADKPSELTLEQQLKFQMSLRDFYLQTTIANDLSGQFQRELSDKAKAVQVQMAQQAQAQSAAQDAVKAACPGEVVGLLTGKPECKLKAPEATDGKPKTDRTMEGK